MSKNGGKFTSSRPFSAEEDVKLWRFAINNQTGYGRYSMWNRFLASNDLKRSRGSCYIRFWNILIPSLPKTLLHAETKLKLCVQHKIPVDKEFLKALQKDANVTLKEGFVVAFTVKPTAALNTDKTLNDEELMKLTCPFVKRRRAKFTKEEDAEIWKYAIENHWNYCPGARHFWRQLVQRKDWTRTVEAVKHRFFGNLVHHLHVKEFDVETKLKLYKDFEIHVDRQYLKTLKKQYTLSLDPHGLIYEYKKIKRDPSANQKKRNPKIEKFELKDELEELDEEKFTPNDDDVQIITPKEIIDRAMNETSAFLTVSDVKMEEIEEDFAPQSPAIWNMNTLPDEKIEEMEEEEVGPSQNDQNLVQNDNFATIMQGIMDTTARNMLEQMANISKNMEESLKNEISEVSKTVGALKEDMEVMKQQMINFSAGGGERLLETSADDSGLVL